MVDEALRGVWVCGHIMGSTFGTRMVAWNRNYSVVVMLLAAEASAAWWRIFCTLHTVKGSYLWARRYARPLMASIFDDGESDCLFLRPRPVCIAEHLVSRALGY